MCVKWEDLGEGDVIIYLKTTYREEEAWGNRKLYYVDPGIPAHNNGLEGINGAFKLNGTMRERAALGTFAESVKSCFKCIWKDI